MTRTYMIKTAVKKARKVEHNDYPFGILGWESPITGMQYGPYFIHVQKNIAIEVSRNGQFRGLMSPRAKYYFPWATK